MFSELKLLHLVRLKNACFAFTSYIYCCLLIYYFCSDIRLISHSKYDIGRAEIRK